MSDWRVAVAIDFGTHASGFAFAEAGDRGKPTSQQRVTVYRDWPESAAFAYFKTRTAILRTAAGDVAAWGNQACADYRRGRRQGTAAGLRLSEGFKLSLLAADEAVSRPAVADAVAFLRQLRGTALKTVRSYFDVSADEIRWCVTMPLPLDGLDGYDAVLRDQVLGPAGFPVADRDRLQLLAEPEAAALCCTKMVTEPGERFVIVDAGGGTVDITTMEASAGGNLRQVGLQAGGKLGSAYLNEKYVELVRDLLEAEPGWQQEASTDPDDWAQIRDTWEQDKRSWEFKPGGIYRVQIPYRTLQQATRASGGESRSIVNGSLLIPNEAIRRQVFAPQVSAILGELDKALADLAGGAGRRSVIVAGGFGTSPYLQDALRRHLAERDGTVTLRMPEDGEPAEAVLRGAVHYALRPRAIQARRMQYTYGCAVLNPCRRADAGHVAAHQWVQSGRRVPAQEMCRQFLSFAVRGDIIDAGTQRLAARLYAADYRQRFVRFTLYRTDEVDPYFMDGCEPVGSVELPIRIRWWQSTRSRPLEVHVTLGESELIFRVADRRRPQNDGEIRLLPSESVADVPA